VRKKTKREKEEKRMRKKTKREEDEQRHLLDF